MDWNTNGKSWLQWDSLMKKSNHFVILCTGWFTFHQRLRVILQEWVLRYSAAQRENAKSVILSRTKSTVHEPSRWFNADHDRGQILPFSSPLRNHVKRGSVVMSRTMNNYIFVQCIWFFQLSHRTTVIQDLLVRRQFSLVSDKR